MALNVSVVGGNLVVTIPISPRPSTSGKSTLVASTGGYQLSTATHDGKAIKVSLNAIVGKG